MLVIPSINVADFEKARSRVKEAEQFLPQAGWLHLDVWQKSWGNPQEFQCLKTRLAVEAHLMIPEPEKAVDDWLKAGVSRLIIHLEDLKNLESLLAKTKMRSVDVMLAINPKTPVEKLLVYLQVRSFQILAVTPGLSGQKFQPAVLEKIKALRQARPEALIEVDGGITPKTAQSAKEAGADIIVSAAYIFDNPVQNPAASYQELGL